MSVHNTVQYIKSQNFTQKELFEVAKWCVSKIQKRLEVCEECGELAYDHHESRRILCEACYNEVGSDVSEDSDSDESDTSDEKSVFVDE